MRFERAEHHGHCGNERDKIAGGENASGGAYAGEVDHYARATDTINWVSPVLIELDDATCFTVLRRKQVGQCGETGWFHIAWPPKILTMRWPLIASSSTWVASAMACCWPRDRPRSRLPV